ncbi:hypothetical protein [Desertibacillus haloalkaliphilus]|uniref:hypothetical protein n=1 Tax=Desertibacillus haloalkaliphilus TaxID=1328930 RepID=UPI001C27409B|nr:hypothetical protein [Desertibacillus haloalkaliphilus]MBU8906060.1 hypothetical protein [Desertibacillus haloalkaliphilus]
MYGYYLYPFALPSMYLPATRMCFHPQVIRYDPIYNQNRRRKRPFPDVDPSSFMDSASASQQLLDSASRLTTAISNDREFSHQIMDAAQRSDFDEVDRLIKEVGIPTEVKTSFNPDLVTFEMNQEVNGMHCCRLVMRLRW